MKRLTTRHSAVRRWILITLTLVYGFIVLLWAVSWVHYVLIGWTSGSLQRMGAQQTLWNRREEWGLFAFEGVAAIGWQARECEGGDLSSAEGAALRKGRPWCFFFPVSPIVWHRADMAWPKVIVDAGERRVQVDARNRWAYRRILFPLAYPAFLGGVILAVMVVRAGKGVNRD